MVSSPSGGGGPPEGRWRGLIRLGEFGRAVGLRGEVRLKSHTADPLAIAGYGPLRTGDGRAVVLSSVRPASGEASDMLVARVEGVGTREGAEALNRLPLLIERERLAPPDEDEFYLADLVGLAVHDAAGPIGRVVAVPDYGSGELLEIAPAGSGPTVLLPFTKAFVPTVDIPGGRVVIDPPPDLFAKPSPDPEA